jgi:hypothetical protein
MEDEIFEVCMGSKQALTEKWGYGSLGKCRLL